MNQLHLPPRTMATRIAALALALACVSTTWALAQTEDRTPRFEGMVEVSEVLLDVLVTDKDGNVVVGLGPEDFVVPKTRRRSRCATSASTPTASGERRRRVAGRSERTAEGEVLADRFFIFFFHDQRLNGAGPGPSCFASSSTQRATPSAG